jgi:predicted  nucleic acid-binding Zn-ribbon protein
VTTESVPANAPPEGPPRGIDRLLELQGIDTALDRLHARRIHLESDEEIRRSRQAVADAETRSGELQLSIDVLAREQRRLEGDVDSFDQKMRDEERRSLDGSVANPRELQSIRAEVEGIKGRKSRVEDRLLEIMEQLEGLEELLGQAQHDIAAASQALSDVEGTSAQELVDVEREIGERSARRDELVPGFDEELLSLYEDLRRHKKGIGAAALRDGVCQGCHQQLSAVELDRLRRATGIRRCDSCRRILVFD